MNAITVQQLSDEQFERLVIQVSDEMVRRKKDGFKIAESRITDEFFRELMQATFTHQDRIVPFEYEGKNPIGVTVP